MRKGCQSCRHLRIKCDERQSGCLQCAKRAKTCSGYTKALKWVRMVNNTSSADSRAKHAQEPFRGHVGALEGVDWRYARVPRSPRDGPELTTSTDVMLFTHWADMSTDLVFPNPDAYSDVRDNTMQILWEPESPLLPAILASSAIHLACQGRIRPEEALRRKGLALSRMISELGRNPRGTSKQLALALPPYPDDAAIVASMVLAGLETTQGGHLPNVVQILRGAKSQLDRRYAVLSANPGVRRDCGPALATYIKMLGYFDAMSCVPCARLPVMDRQFWIQHIRVLLSPDTIAGEEPDLILGYCFEIFPFIGAASAAVEELLRGATTATAFGKTQAHLLQELQTCCDNLPLVITLDPDLSARPDVIRRIRSHNACVSAARAHALAAKIFLVRAAPEPPGMRNPGNDRILRLSVDLLSIAVENVPLDTGAVTMMIWPLFVLGCESADDSPRQHLVQTVLRQILEKEHFLNIQQALATLEERIWPLSKESDENSAGTTATDAGADGKARRGWVRYCWEQNIGFCMA